ncbi:MAG: HD-GYP domain-containing protein [Oxalobacteraceae bacterium]|nr:HD-GYP domain-containing protein [Oxalobacteraceae bacterium]
MNVLKQLGHWLAPDTGNGSVEAAHSGNLLASLLTMAWFVEARDPYTGGHLWRVSRYALLLAESADFGNADAARTSLGGFLHDLGKVGVPDAILRKPGQLTDDEYAVIKTHPDIGLRMLSGHPLSGLVSDAVLLHHERPDGRGYPRGLAGDAIPAMARIVGICDAFDAMTSHRPYRAGMPRDQAIAIIREFRATQFDAHFADVFIALGEAGRLDHVLGHSDDGIPLQTCPMCGPTLVTRSEHKQGDHVYCRNCGGEFALEMHDNRLLATPTGKQGQAADLEPEADSALIARTVRAAVEALPIADLVNASAMPPGNRR